MDSNYSATCNIAPIVQCPERLGMRQAGRARAFAQLYRNMEHTHRYARGPGLAARTVDNAKSRAD